MEPRPIAHVLGLADDVAAIEPGDAAVLVLPAAGADMILDVAGELDDAYPVQMRSWPQRTEWDHS